MPLVQLVAVRNTLDESLEMTRWVNTNEIDVEQVEKEMMALVDRFYPKLSRKGKSRQEKTMIAVGSSGEVLDVPRKEARKLTREIHYALYEGRCLDPKKLSYFLPEKTVEEGELTLEEVKKILSR